MADAWTLGAENFGGQGGFENFPCQVPSLTVNNAILCEPRFPVEGASWEGVHGSGIWVCTISVVCGDGLQGSLQTATQPSLARRRSVAVVVCKDPVRHANHFFGWLGSWPARGRTLSRSANLAVAVATLFAGASVSVCRSGMKRRGRRLAELAMSGAGLGAEWNGGRLKGWQQRAIPSESLAVFRPQARQVTAGGLKIASLSLHQFILSCPAIEDYSGDLEAERSC